MVLPLALKKTMNKLSLFISGTRIRPLIFILFLVIFSCQNGKDKNSYLFENIESNISGLNFTNSVTDTEDFNILEYLYYYNGGGVAIGDINNDGLEDIFFTSNQGSDKLFLNQGDLKFKDVTSVSGIIHPIGWSTGVNIVDINGDGWKDIFICRLGNYKKIKNDYNRVYINDQNGKFTESSIDLGLRFSGFSTQCAFFDFDRDGDLDAYLLNHSVKDASQFRPSEIRYSHDKLAGDILYENKNGKFEDITLSAGILNSSIGYGLGITVADLNNDGWQDIYICNDFHENDYLYINQKNKTFQEVCKASFGHTSNFSMGVDCDDIDEDGLTDILTVDMKPEDELIYKNSGGWENLQIYNFKRSYGYHHQQPKNALQWNRGVNEKGIPIFSEISGLTGLDATDWSWSPLICDFDMDGNKDIFISNGIKRRPNDLDFVHFISNEVSKQETPDLKLIETMPSGARPNFFFRNNGNLIFSKALWAKNNPSLSSGAAIADLDNDGDYDIVLNNFNAPASLLKSTVNPSKTVAVTLKNTNKNSEAIGSKISVFSEGKVDHFIIKAIQGFQSSSSRTIILPKVPDSIRIDWPEGGTQVIKNIKLDRSILINKNNIKDQKVNYSVQDHATVYECAGIRHVEDAYNEQTKESWIPYLLSTNGPKLALSNTSDVAFITNGKNNDGILFNSKTIQVKGTLQKGIAKAAVDENNAVFFDANGDSRDDLYLCLGGNELKSGNSLLSDKLYLSDDMGNFTEAIDMLPSVPLNTSVARPIDYDNDGDIDLFVGVQSRAGSFGLSEPSYLLENINHTSFKKIDLDLNEMLYEAKIADLDNNGFDDIVVCGHWMPITILYNNNGQFSKKSIPNSEGLWFTFELDDVNLDGAIDIIAGNFGNNHSLKCNLDEPLQLQIGDFDKNGQSESLLSYVKNGKRFVFPNKDMFVGQLPSKKKYFLKNKDYAGKTLDQLFTETELKGSVIKVCKNTSSGVFLNDGKSASWKFQPFPLALQVSPIRIILKLLNSSKGNLKASDELENHLYIFGGNFFEVDPNIGRQDALLLSCYNYQLNNSSKSNINWIKAKINLPLINDQVTSVVVSNNNLLIACNNRILKKIYLQDLNQ